MKEHSALLWECDPALRLTWATAVCASGILSRCDDLIGMPVTAVFSADDDSALLRELHASLSITSREFKNVLNGILYHHHVHALRNERGKITGIAGASFNATLLADTARETGEARRALALAESIGPIATFSLDMGNGLSVVTPELRAFWGIPAGVDRMSLDDFLARIHPDDRVHVIQERAAALQTRQPYHIEYRTLGTDGTIRHLRTDGQFFYDAQGRAVRNVGAVLDFTDQLNAQSTVAHLLGHDRLTDLLDRAEFIERIRAATRTASNDESFAIVLFGLDRFRSINEVFGEPAGDLLLRVIAERLRAIEGVGEPFARIGGDEFAGILRIASQDAEEAIARVRAVLKPPVSIGDQQVEVTATFGVSLFPYDGNDDALLAEASIAMSWLKGHSAGGVQRYGREMKRAVAERYRLRSELRDAIDLEQLELVYQPIVDARTLRISAAEALIRWDHPALGIVPPDSFLPAAEEAGLMQEIDAWVLHRACRDAAEIARYAREPLRVSVNASASFLLAPTFKSALESALLSAAMPASALGIEITERSLLTDQARALDVLTWLRKLGVTIAIDDFGTGYNTLSYLKMYPIDIIKIDRSFVSDIERYPYSRSVCSGILALAAELGVWVIAEGVESAEQEAFLASLGCRSLQGFRYGRPMPKAEFVRLVRAPCVQRVS